MPCCEEEICPLPEELRRTAVSFCTSKAKRGFFGKKQKGLKNFPAIALLASLMTATSL
jgi:hypothetical protein